METAEKTPAEKVREYQAHTTGTREYHKTGLGPLVCTDGAKFVADTVGAHWLLDLVQSHQMTPHVRACAFQAWTLEAREEDAVLAVATDGQDDEIVHQEIPYSDFPRELLPFRLWVEGPVILLPEEH